MPQKKQKNQKNVHKIADKKSNVVRATLLFVFLPKNAKRQNNAEKKYIKKKEPLLLTGRNEKIIPDFFKNLDAYRNMNEQKRKEK